LTAENWVFNGVLLY